ncbi:MAG: hypothetical protein ACTIL0_07125 [Microbacterium gubbeenense]
MTSTADWFACISCNGSTRTTPTPDGVEIIVDHTSECPEVRNGN